MNANAPEKIFISYETDEDGRIYPDYMWHRHQFEGVENIEYARTDAFIEKALTYLNSKFYFNNLHYAVENNTFNCMEEMFEDFKNYMKGE